MKYEWIEDCLKAGHILPSEKYTLKFPSDQDTLALEEPSTLALGSSTLASGSRTLLEDHASPDTSRSVDDAGGSSTKKTRREGTITTESDPAAESQWMEVIREGAHMGMVHHSAVVGGEKKSQGGEAVCHTVMMLLILFSFLVSSIIENNSMILTEAAADMMLCRTRPS